MKKNPNKKDDKAPENKQLHGNTVYSANDDIYNQGKKEIFNEDMLSGKDKQKPETKLNEDLDIPGAELDDADEMIGEEDEENNYYSLGGDAHNDLEENKGD